MESTRRLVLLLLLLSLASLLGCRDEGSPPLVQARTPRGEAAGAIARATIGPEGGELVSSDGRLVVRVPAGAFTEAREIDVQPITNRVPGGRGVAYRLEPSGVTFARPVELAFHYEDSDVEGSAPEALLVATQDEAGAWWIPARPTVEVATRTVRLAVPHFSDWSMLAGYRLEPTYATVKVGRALDLRLVFCGSPPSGDYAFVPVYECHDTEAPFDGVQHWQVNGIEGGDGDVGTARASSGVSVRYVAPSAVPAANPVAVSGELVSVLGHMWVVAHVEVQAGVRDARGEREREGCGVQAKRVNHLDVGEPLERPDGVEAGTRLGGKRADQVGRGDASREQARPAGP